MRPPPDDALLEDEALDDELPLPPDEREPDDELDDPDRDPLLAPSSLLRV